MRCRHERNCWILGGAWAWCYRCGALQRLGHDTNGGRVPSSRWVKPRPDGVNPWQEIEKPPIRREKRERET